MKPETQPAQTENEDILIQLFLEAIYLKYGYDFRNYARSHLRRRILRRLQLQNGLTLSQLPTRILHDRELFEMLLLDFSINITEMFRDPGFFLALRREVVPILKTYPFVRIWHAGCSSGAEVYSMAIVLKEEGLSGRTQIYATDFNEMILKQAREGIFPVGQIKEYTLNYQQAGGRESFADYYTANYGSAIVDSSLKKNIVFANHNLATDGVFGEMHLIMCRNVLIYFNKELQNRVLQLFSDSLCRNGFLCLGTKETLQFSDLAGKFQEFNKKERIYRKKNE